VEEENPLHDKQRRRTKMNHYRLKISLSIAGTVIGCAAFGSALMVFFSLPEMPATVGLIAVTVAGFAGFSAYSWTEIAAGNAAQEVENYFRSRIESFARRPEPNIHSVLPEEVAEDIERLTELLLPLGSGVDALIERGTRLREGLSSLAGRLRTIEAERDELRLEAAKVGEIAAVASRRAPSPDDKVRLVADRDRPTPPEFMRRRPPVRKGQGGSGGTAAAVDEGGPEAAVREALEPFE
jgi:hypothetical protein